MLYRHGGPHEIHGGRYSYVIVPESEVKANLDDGWYLTTGEAKAAAEVPAEAAPTVGPTLEECRQKLDELGVDYDKRWGLPRMIREVEQALARKV